MHPPESELIINPDGSIYHLNIQPEQLADTVITVGDPDRVEQVTTHFDLIEFKQRKREFSIQTGTYKGKRISVVSTGIGTDNIDIVLNELDALANIDFNTRQPRAEQKSLTILRLGTTGALQREIPVDSVLFSRAAIGFDGLAHFYDFEQKNEPPLKKFMADLNYNPAKSKPYYVEGDPDLRNKFKQEFPSGITATNPGFYAPQGRTIRAGTADKNWLQRIAQTNFKGQPITNMEMETSGIYFLAKLLGHRALSLNAVLAHRITGEFSKVPEKTTQKMIVKALECLVE